MSQQVGYARLHRLFGLTVSACLAGVTANAARVLGILKETGTIEPGMSAELAIWNCTSAAELVYRIGFNLLHKRIFKGTVHDHYPDAWRRHA